MSPTLALQKFTENARPWTLAPSASYLCLVEGLPRGLRRVAQLLVLLLHSDWLQSSVVRDRRVMVAPVYLKKRNQDQMRQPTNK